jgi:hypothetical protein
VRCLDKLRRLWIVPEGCPDLLNADLQNCITHGRLRPHSIEQLLFGNQAACIAQQVEQYCEVLGREWDRLITPPKTLVDQIESIGSEHNF